MQVPSEAIRTGRSQRSEAMQSRAYRSARIILGPSSDRLPTTKSRANAAIFPRTFPWAQTSRLQLRPAANNGVRSRGAVSAFADLGVRASTGFYDQQQPYYYYAPPPRVGADLTQTGADAGANASGRDYDVTAGV